MQAAIIFPIVLLASFGLFAQCFANLRSRRAAFLAFPIALFLLMPYPLWGTFALLKKDWSLLTIMILLGVPSAWLSSQYFQLEWPRRPRTLAGEEKVALLLLATGAALWGGLFVSSGAATATAAVAAYFTSCLVIYSFLVKLWRVSRKEQTLDGVKWVALLSLALLYAAMIWFAQLRGVFLLKVAYGFAECCVVAAILYKLSLRAQSSD